MLGEEAAYKFFLRGNSFVMSSNAPFYVYIPLVVIYFYMVSFTLLFSYKAIWENFSWQPVSPLALQPVTFLCTPLVLLYLCISRKSSISKQHHIMILDSLTAKELKLSSKIFFQLSVHHLQYAHRGPDKTFFFHYCTNIVMKCSLKPHLVTKCKK